MHRVVWMNDPALVRPANHSANPARFGHFHLSGLQAFIQCQKISSVV